MKPKSTRKISDYVSGGTLKPGLLLCGNYIQQLFKTGETVAITINQDTKEIKINKINN